MKMNILLINNAINAKTSMTIVSIAMKTIAWLPIKKNYYNLLVMF